jgi:hypothetical protein
VSIGQTYLFYFPRNIPPENVKEMIFEKHISEYNIKYLRA